MSELMAERVLLFAGEALAASALAMALAWLASFAGRASLRHLIWAAAFAVLIALPVAAAVVPGAIVFSVPAPAIQSMIPMDLSLASAAPPPAAEGFSFGIGDAAFGLIALWLAGVVLIALRHLIAAFLLRALHRDSVAHPFDASELPALAHGRSYDMRLSLGERGPVTWGIFCPVILLPNQAQFWPHERLQAVLRHELAHVLRRDGLGQILALVACALYWPNPLVWLGARALRREAEIAADDAVIASGMTPSDYAGELLEMAREFRAQGFSTALSMAAPSALPARVQSILAPTQQRSGVTSMDVVKMAAVALLAAGAFVAARPSLAQAAPPAPVVQDVPPAPPVPATDAVPPAPPAPEAAIPAPPAPPTAATPPAPPMMAEAPPAPGAVESVDSVVRIVRISGAHNGHDLRRVRIEMRNADRAIHDAMARVKPEIARAMATVRAHEIEIRRVEEMRPQLNAEINQALADARAQIARIDDQKIRATVDAALARAQARIDKAYAAHREERTIIQSDDPVTP
ncbi:MAG TPA: M56 family metallopeptidase [Rhizomicrobium sp.]